MNISIISVFPDLYTSFLATSLIKRAQEKKLIDIEVSSFLSYVQPKERIDAPTFGPGAGMLIRPEVVEKAINDKESIHGKAFKIFFSPHGQKLDQKKVKNISAALEQTQHLMLLPARYEGMDARVEEHYADEIISVGDFVLMGGDLPAMMLLESLLRLMPGVVGKEESVERDSFSGAFVDFPEYTEPVEWQGKKVPDIVRSGNHEAIRQWRLNQAAERSVLDHFAWVRSVSMPADEKKVAFNHIPSHYTALLHTQVLIGPNERKVGTTSVTSVDIHDIARSSATYGIKKYFIVTPLADQQKIVNTLINFWQKGIGVEYNPVRHEAMEAVNIAESLDQAIAAIEKIEGKKPLLIATSARNTPHPNPISFYDQGLVWKRNHPVLFIFGTGQGLTPDLIERCDYLLPPVEGFTEFNHLSVRSAVAIILDRWLGLNER